MKDTRPFWAQWRDWYFTLSTLGTAAPWDPPKGHKARVYTDGTFAFHESQIEGHFDEVEEQLWAFHHGLSNVVQKMTIRAIKG